jgi:hypothetical protein
MVQMLPFFDLLTHSQRELNYQSTRWAMPGWGWANLLVPLFHNFRAPDGIWYQHDQEFLLSYYLGAGVLILAVAGALKRSRLALALATMSLFCWTLALGSEGHLYDWIKSVFPYISIARFFVKYTILTSLLIPLLAAFGIEGILSSPGTKAQKQITILGTGALLLMGFLLWFAWRYSFRFDEWASTGWDTLWRALIMIAILTGVLFLPKQKNNRARYTLQAVLLGLVLTDALTHNPLMTPTLPSSYLAPGMWTGSGKPPSPELGKGRIMISPEAEAHLLRNAITRFDYIFTGKRLAEWSNLNLVDQIPKVTGALTLRPAHFDYIEKYLYYTEDASYGEGFLDFVSAAWISSKENPVQWTARTNFLPVMTAGQRPEFANDQLALIGITTNNFDPRAMVYLPESVRSLVTVSNTTVCKLANVRFSLNKVEAETDASETSMVVLSQTFYHLWHAEVDGKPTPLLRANVAFQALQVPPGIHQIKLIYRDRNFVIGGIISLLSLFLCIALALCEHFLSGSKQPAHLPEK